MYYKVEDLENKNHKLVLVHNQDSVLYRLYKCSVCHYDFHSYNETKNIYIKNNLSISNDLTCEELVIKNIIE